MENATGRTVFVAGAVIALLLHAPGLLAQDSTRQASKEASDPKTTRIALRDGVGMPGTSVVIPLYFTPAKGAEVGSLELKVNFVSANLKFDKIQPGLAIESGELDLQTDLSAQKNAAGVETSTLAVKFFPAGPQRETKSIREGLLGYIVFKILETGGAAKIGLRTSAEARERKSNKALSNVVSIDAQVEVLVPGKEPAVTCFFFSH